MKKENSIDNLPDVSSILLDPNTAIEEINRRHSDVALKNEVGAFLRGDIPAHFSNSKPVAYLSRHIASPNYETIRFVELTNDIGIDRVIGEDREDKFVSNNELKKCLGKLPIEVGIDKNGKQIIKNHTVISFNDWNGKPLYSVRTNNNLKLTDLHAHLMNRIIGGSVQIVDESDWVRRNLSGDFLEYYEKFLALFVCHAVMYEFYAVEDEEFVETILKPICEKINKRFGLYPVIAQLLSGEEEFTKNWLSYPPVTTSYIHELDIIRP